MKKLLTRDQVNQLFEEIRDRSQLFTECLTADDTESLAQRFGLTPGMITRLELRFGKFFMKVYRALARS